MKPKHLVYAPQNRQSLYHSSSIQQGGNDIKIILISKHDYIDILVTAGLKVLSCQYSDCFFLLPFFISLLWQQELNYVNKV